MSGICLLSIDAFELKDPAELGKKGLVGEFFLSCGEKPARKLLFGERLGGVRLWGDGRRGGVKSVGEGCALEGPANGGRIEIGAGPCLNGLH